MNRPNLSPGATLAISMLGALLGVRPCDDPECQACNGKDEQLTSEAAKAQAEKAVINTGARAFVEDRVMKALHEVLRQAKHELIELEHSVIPVPTNAIAIQQARIDHAQSLLTLLQVKANARREAQPPQSEQTGERRSSGDMSVDSTNACQPEQRERA